MYISSEMIGVTLGKIAHDNCPKGALLVYSKELRLLVTSLESAKAKSTGFAPVFFPAG